MDEALAFVDALIDYGTDFIDVLVNDFRHPLRHGAMAEERSRLNDIAETVAGRVQVFADGEIRTEADAISALDTGIDFVTLVRAMTIDPEGPEGICKGYRSHTARTSGGSARAAFHAGSVLECCLDLPPWVPRS